MKSLEELKVIREKMQGQVALRSEHGADFPILDGYRKHVLVCGGTGCTSSGSKKILEKLEEEIKKHGLENEVGIVKTGCFGLCALGPIMIVYPEGAFYSMVKEDDIPEIVSEHLANGNVVTNMVAFLKGMIGQTSNAVYQKLIFNTNDGKWLSGYDQGSTNMIYRTNTETGLTEGKHCDVCGETFYKTERHYDEITEKDVCYECLLNLQNDRRGEH